MTIKQINKSLLYVIAHWVVENVERQKICFITLNHLKCISIVLLKVIINFQVKYHFPPFLEKLKNSFLCYEIKFSTSPQFLEPGGADKNKIDIKKKKFHCFCIDIASGT